MSYMDSIQQDIDNAWADVKNYLPASRDREALLKALDEAASLLERIASGLSLTKPADRSQR